MQFFKAGTGDINDLTQLRLEYLLDDYGEIPQDRLDLIAKSLPDYFCKHLNADIFAFLCREGGQAAACCLLYVLEKPANPSFINGRTGSVLNVYTRPQFRRRGIARELMKMLLSEAGRLGLDFVELKSTDEGYELYRSVGFEDAASKYHNMKFVIDKRNM